MDLGVLVHSAGVTLHLRPLASSLVGASLLASGCQPLDDVDPAPLADGGRIEAGPPDSSGGLVDRQGEGTTRLDAIDASPDGPGEASRAVPCPETTVVSPEANARAGLSVELVLAGKPMIFGERNDLSTGGAVTPLNLRFYLAHFSLARAGAPPVQAPLVTTAGTPAPYDVHLFNAEDPVSSNLTLAAPAGDYTGLEFVFGLDDECNAATLKNLKPPLSPTSQMSWPHLAGYLFFRFEGRVESSVEAGTGPDGASRDQVPAMIHMGGALGPDFGSPTTLSAPVLRITKPIHLEAAAPTQQTLRVVFEEIFRGATAEVDASTFFGPPSPEAFAGERLRQSAPMLAIFELVPR